MRRLASLVSAVRASVSLKVQRLMALFCVSALLGFGGPASALTLIQQGQAIYESNNGLSLSPFNPGSCTGCHFSSPPTLGALDGMGASSRHARASNFIQRLYDAFGPYDGVTFHTYDGTKLNGLMTFNFGTTALTNPPPTMPKA